MKTLETETHTNKLVLIQKVLVAVDLSDHSEATTWCTFSHIMVASLHSADISIIDLSKSLWRFPVLRPPLALRSFVRKNSFV
jgi:hypothetical protein